MPRTVKFGGPILGTSTYVNGVQTDRDVKFTLNRMEDIVNGDFIWDIQTTTSVPFKSGTVKVGWTSEGLSVLLGGDD